MSSTTYILAVSILLSIVLALAAVLVARRKLKRLLVSFYSEPFAVLSVHQAFDADSAIAFRYAVYLARASGAQALLPLVLLLAALWITAQTNPGQAGTTSGTQTGTQTSASTINAIRGCLSGSLNNYVLADRSGNTYQVTGDDAELSKHLGEEVELTGNLSTPMTGTTTSPASAAAGTEPSGKSSVGTTTGEKAPGAAAAANMFNVSKIKKISGSCSTK